MAITRQKKEEIIKKLEEGLASAETAVFVGFKGVTVTDTVAMRKTLREKGVTYFVAKKTLMKRVLEARGIKGTMPETPGEVALVWSKDPIAAPKGIYEFVQKHKEKIVLLGGVYQGEYYAFDQMMTLATIPSREELYGKFVGMINATYGNLVRALEQRRKQLEATPA